MNYFDEHETKLQPLIKRVISDPSALWTSSTGKQFQILSSGKLNVSSGPDYKDIALLVDGKIIIGDAEFHKKSSGWQEHGHSRNSEYSKVILHIVLEHNMEIPENFLTLEISHEKLQENKKKHENSIEPQIRELEDLQDFALLRILRRTYEAKEMLQEKPFAEVLNRQLYMFLQRFNLRSRRPIYNAGQLEDFLKHFQKSEAAGWLFNIPDMPANEIIPSIQELVSKKLFNEGKHLRQEIITNCLLPVVLSKATLIQRNKLFIWYWSAKAGTIYGKLARRFPDIPQDYIWQQQGMLEYLRDYGDKRKAVSERLKDYKVLLNK